MNHPMIPRPPSTDADVQEVRGDAIANVSFGYQRFAASWEVKLPTSTATSTTSIVAELISDGDEDGLQVWKVTVELPIDSDLRSGTARVTRNLRVPGHRQAVDFVNAHGARLARGAAVALEARRIFNEGIAEWTAGDTTHALPTLNPGEGSELLKPLAYDHRHLVLTVPGEEPPR